MWFYVGARINYKVQKSEETGEYCEDVVNIWTEKTASQVFLRCLKDMHT